MNLFMRVSHEIRTPVTIIDGLTQLMADWDVPLEQQSTMAELSVASRQLSRVVKDLLAFSAEDTNPVASKDDAGQEGNATPSVDHGLTDNNTRMSGAAPVDFSLREAIDSVVQYHLPQAEASGVKVYLDFPEDLPIEVRGARSQLMGILDHLMDNATKFTLEGSISIKVFESESLLGM